jgi:hypothetical protein
VVAFFIFFLFRFITNRDIHDSKEQRIDRKVAALPLASYLCNGGYFATNVFVPGNFCCSALLRPE